RPPRVAADGPVAWAVRTGDGSPRAAEPVRGARKYSSDGTQLGNLRRLPLDAVPRAPARRAPPARDRRGSLHARLHSRSPGPVRSRRPGGSGARVDRSAGAVPWERGRGGPERRIAQDRKSTRLNSSHLV